MTNSDSIPGISRDSKWDFLAKQHTIRHELDLLLAPRTVFDRIYVCHYPGNVWVMEKKSAGVETGDHPRTQDDEQPSRWAQNEARRVTSPAATEGCRKWEMGRARPWYTRRAKGAKTIQKLIRGRLARASKKKTYVRRKEPDRLSDLKHSTCA